MTLKFSNLLFLGSLILLITLAYSQDQDSDDNLDFASNMGGFDLYDLFGDDDYGNMEDLMDLFNKNTQDYDGESLAETVAENNHVLVLYLNDDYPEDNKLYEEFFKTLGTHFNSGAIEVEIQLARIYVDEETDISSYYIPKNFPALVVFDHVRMFEYDDELELPEFFGWFNQITSREFTELEDQDSFNRFLESDDNPKLVAFYNSRDAQELELLSELSKKEYLIHLDIRQVAICLDHCNAKYEEHTFKRPSLVLFRNYEKTTPYAVLDQHLDQAEPVFAFCNYESVPPVLYHDELNHTKIFGEVIRSHITMILDPRYDNSEIISQFEKSAYYNRDNEPQEQRMTHIIDLFDDEDTLQWFYNVHSTEDLPKLFITETAIDLSGVHKFKYTSNEPLNYETIRRFITDYREGKLEHFYVSEDAPDNQGKLVHKVVGTSFKAEVKESDVNYILFICPDLNDHMCSDPLETFEKVAQKANNEGDIQKGKLQFGYIDGLRNEMDMDLGDSFPDVRLLKIGEKNKPVIFGGYFTEEELGAWVKEQTNQIEHERNRKTAEKVDIEL